MQAAQPSREGHQQPEQGAGSLAHVLVSQLVLTLSQVSQEVVDLLPQLNNQQQEILIIGQIKLIP